MAGLSHLLTGNPAMTISPRRLNVGRHSKVESDIEDDAQVRDSLAYRRSNSSYVGHTAPEDDFAARPTGAEAGSHER